MRIRGWRVALTLVVGASLAACGSGGGGGSSSAGASDPTVDATVVTPSSSAPATTAAQTTSAVPTTSAAPTDAASAYAVPGPYPVGVTEVAAPDSSITVFYPALDGSEEGHEPAVYHLADWLPTNEAPKVADLAAYTMAAYRDLPPADPDGGPYPLVLFSHGLAGYRLQSTFLTTHLASWGFVVAAVEHPYRNLTAMFGDVGSIGETIGTASSPDVAQLLGAIDVVQAASDDPASMLAGLAVDIDHIGAVGHSLGGFAVFNAARDPRIDSYVALAFPVGGSLVDSSTATTVAGPGPPDKPSMLVAGSADAIAPLPRVHAAYGGLPAPKALAIVEGMTHLGFSDICALTPPGTPDVLNTAMQLGVAVPPLVAALFADGCSPSHTAAQDVWPVLDQLTTAHLKATLGVDPDALDFDEAALNAAFPLLRITYTEDR